MKYEITKEQILSLYTGGSNQKKIKEWFPEVFETVLEVGKWYLWKNVKTIAFIEKLSKNDFVAYGINYLGLWRDSGTKDWTRGHEGWREATESEVFEALKNEAVKRGYADNYVTLIAGAIGEQSDKIINDYFMSDGDLMAVDDNGCTTIFSKGKWAEIIPPITKEEAEKLLNKKIV